MKYELKRLGVASVAKIYALIGLIIGILYGGIIFLMMLIGSISAASFGGDARAGGLMIAVIGAVIAVFVLIACVVVYAVIGAIAALLYNAFAKSIGGIEMELSEKK